MLCMFHVVFSQETEKVKAETHNEIKLNLFMTLLSYPDISYERVWEKNFGLGLSIGFPIDGYETKYRILPYGRFYFGETSTKSFFIEANAALEGYEKYIFSSTKNADDSFHYYTDTKKDISFGAGVAFGYKYINKRGFIGEIFFGMGRSFTREGLYPRVGISLGKQF